MAALHAQQEAATGAAPRCSCGKGHVDRWGMHAVLCHTSSPGCPAGHQHAELNRAVADWGAYVGGTVRLRQPQAPAGPGGRGGRKLGDKLLTGVRERYVAIDGANVGVYTVGGGGDLILVRDTKALDQRQVGAFSGARCAREGFCPTGVGLAEDLKIETSRAQFAAVGMDFLPAILSQGGVMGRELVDFLGEMAGRGAADPELRRQIDARGRADARATLEAWMLAGLAAAHAAAKGRRVRGFFDSYRVQGGRDPLTPARYGEQVLPIARRGHEAAQHTAAGIDAGVFAVPRW